MTPLPPQLPVRDIMGQPDDVLSAAYDIIRGERLQHYGPPTENFKRIAGMWSAYLGVEVTPNDVCALMILLKQARMKTGDGYHRDSAVDTGGYTALQEVLNEDGANFPTQPQEST